MITKSFRIPVQFTKKRFPHAAWKVSKYGVFSGPYFPVFSGPYFPVSVRIQSESGEIQTRKNSVFGHFSRSGRYLYRPCWICWDENQYIKLWIRETSTHSKKWISYWTNKEWIRWKNSEIVFRTKTKHVELFDMWWLSWWESKGHKEVLKKRQK